MKTLPLLLLIFLLSSCSVQNTAARPSRTTEFKSVDASAASTGSATEENSASETNSVAEIAEEAPKTPPAETKTAPSVAEPVEAVEAAERKVRVLLHKNLSSRNIFIHGKVNIVSKTLRIGISSGNLNILFVDENTVQISAFGRSAEIALPCTLSFVSGASTASTGSATECFSDGDKKYRGGIIFTGDKQGFSIINYVDVEDYLRGVVPLEIGVRPESDFEALKAQAVAARTYALARVLRMNSREFDLLPTVSDQVYGGANPEYKLSDSAIVSTKGIVMLGANGLLLDAFYHATCAGKTAAVNEVWNSSPNPSLVSRNDTRENGESFCRHANTYSWRETWTIQQFSQILQKYSRQTSGETPFDGTVKSLSVQSRTPSGRVASLKVVSDRGTYYYGRDRVRFVLRRPTNDEGILRSARFDIKIQGSQVIATGSGFGHGIGLCQNGALGRSRAGQNFREILSAYYTDIKFSQWDEIR